MDSDLRKTQIKNGIDAEKALKVLQPEGTLSKIIKGFEPRDQQQNMMRNIIEAYNHDQIALIEAGTGTGKSIAYLIPAILWAAQRKERSVISTHTITLQEQLLIKDIPIVCKALNVTIKAVLVKGMRNYACLRKIEETRGEQLILHPQEAEEFAKIDAWAHNTPDGSKSSLSFEPSSQIWDKVCAENDTCNKNHCPYYQDCHFFKARREAAEAQILIVNHHLLFADLASRAESDNYQDPSILPLYTKVVLDEAHHIEDIATEYFAQKVNQLDLLRIVGRLAAEKGGKSLGKLTQLKEKILSFFNTKTPPKEISPILATLNIDLPGIRNDLLKYITEGFDKFHNFINLAKAPSRSTEEISNENKLRMLPEHYQNQYWIGELKTHIQELVNVIQKYVQVIYGIENSFKSLGQETLQEQTKGIRFEIEALCLRLTLASQTLQQFIQSAPPPSKVRWIEAQMLKTMINVYIADAELDIAKALANYLFTKFSSVILCSATLTTNKRFDFAKQRLGLTPYHIKDIPLTENVYDSPFNYRQQALLVVPTDLPNPQESSFTLAAAEKIWETIQISHGNAFVLFTSYSMLKNCYQILESRLQKNKYPVFKQGDDNRQTLLGKFKNTERSVLFGTDSFWEGVDVVGDALRCVIIVKLPFKVPTEPIIQARTEAILAQGRDPFMEYSLPSAVVKFKQGFGRLIRNKNDRGCIVCLDTRLINKRYGLQFLNSLPSCEQAFLPSEQVRTLMQEFYKKTYHLVKK
ncbi:MAG: ATP-dependent DNA helicase DinG [Chlamydiales bacterium 38-26]|nr:DEAD/DEAH box helicase family protein [Chlamydiales bacterium]OJV11164.1 MAG: ATP-dependent DNA helicase DinG [Chlamydiales bacterium 38-26]